MALQILMFERALPPVPDPQNQLQQQPMPGIFRVRVIQPVMDPSGTSAILTISAEMFINPVDNSNGPLPPADQPPQVMYDNSKDRLCVTWKAKGAIHFITLDNSMSQTSYQCFGEVVDSLSTVMCNNCPTIATSNVDWSMGTIITQSVNLIQVAVPRSSGSPPAPPSARPQPSSPDWYAFGLPAVFGSLPFRQEPSTPCRPVAFAYTDPLQTIHLVQNAPSIQNQNPNQNPNQTNQGSNQIAIYSMALNDFKTIQTNPSLIWAARTLGGLQQDYPPTSGMSPVIVTGKLPTLYCFYRSDSPPISIWQSQPSRTQTVLQYFTVPLQTTPHAGAFTANPVLTNQPPITWTANASKPLSFSGTPSAISLAVPITGSPTSTVNMLFVFFACTFVDDGGAQHYGIRWIASPVPNDGSVIQDWQFSDYIIPSNITSPQGTFENMVYTSSGIYNPGDSSCTTVLCPNGWLVLGDDTANVVKIAKSS